MLNLRRIEPGTYLSADGRVRVRRSHGATLCWQWFASVDGNALPGERTKADAVRAAEAELRRRDGLS